MPPERRSLQLSCCQPAASYYAEGVLAAAGPLLPARQRDGQDGSTHCPEPATWRGTLRARDGRHTGSRRARVTGRSTSSRGRPYAKDRAVLVPVQVAGGLTWNASSSTNEMKHPAEAHKSGRECETVGGWLACLRISSCSRSPVALRLGGGVGGGGRPSVEDMGCHPGCTGGCRLGVDVAAARRR